MKIFPALVSVAFVFTVSSCARQTLPPPYPDGDREPAETATPIESIDISHPDKDADGTISGPQPIARPDISGAEIDLPGQGFEGRALSAGYVNDRIRIYKEKFQLWKELDQQSAIGSLDPQQTQIMVNCYRDLQRLLNGYQSLHSRIFQMGGDTSSISTEDIIGLQRQDISFLEGRCQTLLDGPDGADGVSMAAASGSPVQIEQMIDTLYNNMAYGELAEAWSKIPPYQKDRVSRAAKIKYGDSLTHLDQPDRAAEVYQQIVDTMSTSKGQGDDLLSARKRLADLYVASGNFFAAETQYEQLSQDYAKIGSVESWARLQLSMLEQSMKGSPELTDYSELLRAYLKYSPDLDGYAVVWKAETFLQNYPYSPVSANVDIIKEETLLQADDWFGQKLGEVDRLVEEKQTQEAITMLQAIPQDKLSPENMATLKEKLDSLVLAEAVERETVKIEKMQALQSIWNEGTAMAESGDFEGAVNSFNQLLGTEYEARAQERIQELSLTAAKTERRRAADLFVRSTKTDDVEAQKQLLTQSWQVLNNILSTYPDVEVADKVRGNIRTVEKKINELDPLLLAELQEKERQKETAMPVPQIEADGFEIESSPEVESQPPQSPRAPTALPVYTPQSLQLQ